MREHWIANTKGRQMLVRDHGDPDDPRCPVLGLPGYARTGKDFDHVAARVAPRRLITLDYRGRGRSDREEDWRAYHPITLVDDIRQVLVALQVHRVVIIGTSIGGMLAMGLGVVLPMTVSAVVLNDIGPHVEPAGGDEIMDYIGRDTVMPDWPAAATYLKQLLPDLSLRTDDEWLTFAQNTFREADDGRLHVDWDPAIVKPLQENPGSDSDLWALFGSLRRVPVLTVHGSASTVLSAESVKCMQAVHPEMQTVVLDGIGHAPTLDEPEASKALTRFLDQNAS